MAETTVRVAEAPALVLAGYVGEPLRDLDAYRAVGGYVQLEKARAEDPAAVIQQVIESNLRGRGGAFFPTGRKASFIPTPDKIARPIYITVNADESEPGTFKDREIMLKVPHRLLEGCLIAAHAIQSKQVYIYIRGEYLEEYESLQGALDQARDAGILGAVDIVIHRGAGAYICGEETALLESLEGKRGQPRSKPPFPAISGVYASPTLINNVESITTIPAVLAVGPAQYATIGAPPDSTGTRLFCLSGNVEKPGVYEAPHGITVRHLIYDVGGGVPDGHTLKAVMMGGSSFPVMTPDDLDTPMDADSLGAKGYFIGSGVVTVIDERSCIVQFALRVAQFYMHESCGKCTPCRVGTRWLVQLMRAVEDGTATERDLELTLDVCDRIIGKCLCVLGDSAAMPVASCVTKFRDEFREHLAHGGCPFGADSQLAGLFAPVDQHAHTTVPLEAGV
ncbi:MAG TPA: NADH-quinone oxidoreductase subunit NuoF [Gaiellaceae bacterium]|nr:NADH-quinone oxidoreductase subunit NuoF [Gaiellaceae bacterium]